MPRAPSGCVCPDNADIVRALVDAASAAEQRERARQNSRAGGFQRANAAMSLMKAAWAVSEHRLPLRLGEAVKLRGIGEKIMARVDATIRQRATAGCAAGAGGAGDTTSVGGGGGAETGAAAGRGGPSAGEKRSRDGKDDGRRKRSRPLGAGPVPQGYCPLYGSGAWLVLMAVWMLSREDTESRCVVFRRNALVAMRAIARSGSLGVDDVSLKKAWSNQVALLRKKGMLEPAGRDRGAVISEPGFSVATSLANEAPTSSFISAVDPTAPSSPMLPRSATAPAQLMSPANENPYEVTVGETTMASLGVDVTGGAGATASSVARRGAGRGAAAAAAAGSGDMSESDEESAAALTLPAFPPPAALRWSPEDVVSSVRARWEVVLLVDTREMRDQRDRTFFLDHLRNKGVLVEEYPLPVGDFAWVVRPRGSRSLKHGAFMMDVLIERKDKSDLSQSVQRGKDGQRYLEQQHRLNACPVKRIIFLFEGASRSLAGGIGNKELSGAMRGARVWSGFAVKHTASPEASVLYLASLHRTLKDIFYRTDRVPAASDVGAGGAGAEATGELETMRRELRGRAGLCEGIPTLVEFNGEWKKSNTLTVGRVLGGQLMQVPKMGEHKARAVMERFGTFAKLARAYETARPEVRPFLVASLKVGSQTVGDAASKKVAEVFR